MKMNVAIACLLASTQAIRFAGDGADLTTQEDEALIRPTMIAEGLEPKKDQGVRELVIQQSEDLITNQ